MSIRKAPAALAPDVLVAVRGRARRADQPQAVLMMADAAVGRGPRRAYIKAVWQVIATGFEATTDRRTGRSPCCRAAACRACCRRSG